MQNTHTHSLTARPWPAVAAATTSGGTDGQLRQQHERRSSNGTRGSQHQYKQQAVETVGSMQQQQNFSGSNGKALGSGHMQQPLRARTGKGAAGATHDDGSGGVRPGDDRRGALA